MTSAPWSAAHRKASASCCDPRLDASRIGISRAAGATPDAPLAAVGAGHAGTGGAVVLGSPGTVLRARVVARHRDVARRRRSCRRWRTPDDRCRRRRRSIAIVTPLAARDGVRRLDVGAGGDDGTPLMVVVHRCHCWAKIALRLPLADQLGMAVLDVRAARAALSAMSKIRWPGALRGVGEERVGRVGRPAP